MKIPFRYDRFKNSVDDSLESGTKADGTEEIGKTVADNSEVPSSTANGNAEK